MTGAPHGGAPLSREDFLAISRMVRESSGIVLSDVKRDLVNGRLRRRLRTLGIGSFSEYREILEGPDGTEERVHMVNAITTNLTNFFREPHHFEFLRNEILPKLADKRKRLRIWSAGCSTGEEPYTIAMVLMDTLGDGHAWEITASDISTRILDRARGAHYAMERANNIPPALLRKFCLKGVRSQEGTFLIAPELRQRVHFRHLNLFQPLPDNMGQFDVIFLRNVMIYFDMDTKRKVVANLVPKLRRDGYFLVGHSETLGGITDQLTSEKPSIYRKP